MSAASPQLANSSTDQKQRPWAVIALYLLVVAAVFATAAYAIQMHRTGQRATPVLAARDPGLLRDATPLTSSQQETLNRAMDLVQHKRWREAMPLLGSVAKYGDDPSLRAKSLLLAGTTLGLNNDDLDEAARIFVYFLREFPQQPGTDVARYHLAALYLQREKLHEAESLLTAILRDTPDSPLAASAAYVAAENASLLARRDTEANHRVGTVVAQILPTALGPMVSQSFAIVAAIGTLFLYFLINRDKLRKEKSLLTVICILFVMLLNGYTTYQNQQKQMREVNAITKAAAQQQVIPSR
jgi:TolA-binding protein